MSLSTAALQENAFREHYHRYETAVHDAISNGADTVVLWRLGDDLNEYLGLVNEVGGRAEIILPAYDIDPDFLRWAYSLRSTSSIARFLGISRGTVRTALLAYGIAVPRQQPTSLSFRNHNSGVQDTPEDDYLVDPDEQPAAGPGISSYTGPLSTISDEELDGLLIRLRRHYRRAGITMFDGMLRRLGHHVPRERIRQALIRVDPVQRVFQRIRIRRRTYHVPGPNALWHHDGQHGIWALPTDVHNVRIERLWADITAQIGATWADVFIILELHHGLNINNAYHIWLLHYLFLNQINLQLRFFMEAWNQHQIRICNGPNRSPADMFGFDMLALGVRGTDLLSNEELEVYRVDWEGLRDDTLLESRQENNPMDEGSTSWIGRSGPPDRMNEVAVEPPLGPFSTSEIEIIDSRLAGLRGAVGDAEVAELWTEGLILARQMHPDLY
ncbi:hypothetical protein C8F04DRAFT_966135 [Mycena alexandri]|uniref:Integrase core domain-containing protein n=1 Tax=Mycena alexandri TaxID=1745969 RepID=A0AAD6WVH8_9AGAR|nr:hypothetical protein C8F04DRAFT_966135 [Mycena alexandri]